MPTRRWTMSSGVPRMDVDGNAWFACDPYPTWFRYEDGELIEPDEEPLWAEENNYQPDDIDEPGEIDREDTY